MGSVCLEMRMQGAQAERICDVHETESILWQVESSSGRFVGGTSTLRQAAGVEVVLDDGTRLHAPVVRPSS